MIYSSCRWVIARIVREIKTALLLQCPTCEQTFQESKVEGHGGALEVEDLPVAQHGAVCSEVKKGNRHLRGK